MTDTFDAVLAEMRADARFEDGRLVMDAATGRQLEGWADRLAASGQGVPEGWKLVPVVPTPEMLAHFWAVANGQHPMDERPWSLTKRQMRQATAAYRRMLAAAPGEWNN